jgi:hypothetical protein
MAKPSGGVQKQVTRNPLSLARLMVVFRERWPQKRSAKPSHRTDRLIAGSSSRMTASMDAATSTTNSIDSHPGNSKKIKRLIVLGAEDSILRPTLWVVPQSAAGKPGGHQLNTRPNLTL